MGLAPTTVFLAVLQHRAEPADTAAEGATAPCAPDRSGARCSGTHEVWRGPMLHYAVVFFIIALIAAVFGFGGIAAGAVGIAKVLFFVFLILAAVSLIANLARRS